MARNGPVIAAQQDVLRNMYHEHVAKGLDYALVDFPNHPNVGDSAIWLGEIILLKEITGKAPAYVSSARDFDMDLFLKSTPKDAPLFIHGGGNLGDIWPEHQNFRIKLLESVKDRPVIQLPQSISFKDQAEIDRFARAAGEHPDFTLYVRDRKSEAFARELIQCQIGLAPDSAFGIGAVARPVQSDVDTVLLLRTDVEKAAFDRDVLAALPRSRVIDWLEEDVSYRKTARREAALRHPLKRLGGDDAFRPVLFDSLARMRVQRGFEMLSRGQAVITDRLHAHILSLLLDIPHVALDNSYGKIANYSAVWTSDYPAMRKATTAEDAVAALAELRAAPAKAA